MAGYIFSLKDIESLFESIEDGVYSTIMKIPKNEIWGAPHEGTFGDYITMKEGNNVYFFHNRKLYGIGELININGDSKFLNFPNADLPQNHPFNDLKKNMILNKSAKDKNKRMICTFKGAPYFFNNGVDMDEVLSSNPDKFKVLRAFWKLSFIKIDNEENKALIDVILKNNEFNLQHVKNTIQVKDKVHSRIKKINISDYQVNSNNILMAAGIETDKIKHEMALEVGILDYISNEKGSEFGSWDYLSHQVIASPFKPIDYMDKMDIFGYKYIPNFQTISKYLVIEVKKDNATLEDINQVMKYVDWVNQEYSFGNYSMIDAFLVAYNFPDEVVELRNKTAKRNFIKGRRPVIPVEWNNLRLFRYRFDSDQKKLNFTEI